jgi:hypothetical protein
MPALISSMRLPLLCILLALSMVGCATDSSSLSEVSLGMTKQEVRDRLGSPTVARGALSNKYGQTVEVVEYKLAMPTDETVGSVVGKSALTVLTLGMGAVMFKGERRDFWLYFHDGKLVQWGQAGDWRKEADRIYEYRFR